VSHRGKAAWAPVRVHLRDEVDHIATVAHVRNEGRPLETSFFGLASKVKVDRRRRRRPTSAAAAGAAARSTLSQSCFRRQHRLLPAHCRWGQTDALLCRSGRACWPPPHPL